MRSLHHNPRLWITTLYIFLGTLWVLLSELVGGHLFADDQHLTSYEFVEDGVFIILTAFLLYTLIGMIFRKCRILALTISNDESDASTEQLALAKAVYQSSHDGICITDIAGNILAANPAFSTITGYSETELEGMNPRAFQSGYHSDEFYRQMWASIIAHDNWAGEIWNRRKDGHTYPVWLSINAVRDESGKLANYIGFFSDLTRIKRSEEQLLFQANHDALTNLPNRQMFHARLEQAIAQANRHDYMLAVLMLDMDNFKDINDSFGLKAGDTLLQDIARRIIECVRAEDIVARPGGDEMLIALNEIRQPHQVMEVTEKILTALSRPCTINGQEVYISACVGISLYPENGSNPELLIRNADTALYRAKEKGSQEVEFYSEALSHSALERVTLLSGLRRALKQNELELHYQPQLYSETKQLAGIEALVRWRNPEQGIILPDQFIPLAEQSGLIHDLGNWVLEEACRQMSVWNKAGLKIPRVAINISAAQLINDGLVTRLEQLIEKYELDPEMLELELTETAIMVNPEEAAKILAATAKLGIPLAVDDFGTGYSSLSYLQCLHPQRLKIDRAFVQGLPHDQNNAQMCQVIIAMADHLGMETVAEGVEDTQQWEFLRNQSCSVCQGWLFAKAMPAKELENWLNNH